MPVLSKTILTNLGINLSDEAFTSLSEHFEETLDTRHPHQVNQSITMICAMITRRNMASG